MTFTTFNVDVFFDEKFQFCQKLYFISTSFTIYFAKQFRIFLQNFVQLCEYLHEKFWIIDFERMTSHLWMMFTQLNVNIFSLHQQIIKKRAIIITKNFKLHLIWIYDRIFIKFLAKYLFSYFFLNKIFVIEKKFFSWKRSKKNNKIISKYEN